MLNTTIKALYNENVVHNVTVNGTESSDAALSKYVGERVVITIKPKQDHDILGVSIVPSSVQNMSSIRNIVGFIMPDSDVVVTPKYVKEVAFDGKHAVYYGNMSDDFDSIRAREITIPELDTRYDRSCPIRFTSISANAISDSTLPSIEIVNIPSTVKTIDSKAFGIYDRRVLTVNINAPTNSIPNAPWGIINPVINWLD